MERFSRYSKQDWQIEFQIASAIDNTKFTIKQKYDSAKDEFVNYYYFRVKNSAVVPPLGATTMIRLLNLALMLAI